VGREMAMVIPFTLQALCIVSVLTLGKLSGGWFITTMIAVYFTWGSMFSLFPAIIGDYFGANHATSNYGFLYTAKGVASIGGGWIAAKVFEKFGNWNADFYSTAALALLSGILILVVRAMPLPGQGSEGAEPVMVVAKVS
jgi:MFS transporter, OFA family, oxalate/formate antiporter